MVKELTQIFCSLPEIQKVKGGVTLDYTTQNSGISIRDEGGVTLLFRYMDGTKLLSRRFRAEMPHIFSGVTCENEEMHTVMEQIEAELQCAKFPAIKEGEIKEIQIGNGTINSKTAIGEGRLSFRFDVIYKTDERGVHYDFYAI